MTTVLFTLLYFVIASLCYFCCSVWLSLTATEDDYTVSYGYNGRECKIENNRIVFAIMSLIWLFTIPLGLSFFILYFVFSKVNETAEKIKTLVKHWTY